MSDDILLLRLYAESGKQEAFASLVERRVSLVYAVALRQLHGSVHRAEDVTQGVFIELARQASTLARRDDIVGWLYTTTHHLAAQLKRAESRRQRREQEAHSMNETLSEKSTDADWERVRPVIDDAMLELGEVDRQAILLRFFCNERFTKIGNQLGVGEDAARMRVERALERLRSRLSRHGIASTAAALGATLANQGSATTVPQGFAASVAAAAVTGVGGTAGLNAGVIGFLNMPNVTTGAAVVLVLALGVAFYEFRETRNANERLDAERREVFALVTRLNDVQRQAKELGINTEGARVDTDGPAMPADSTPEREVNGPFGPEQSGSRARGRALAAAYPEIQEMVISRVRDGIAARFRPLYRELGLNEGQIDSFEKIMMCGVGNTLGGFPGQWDTVTVDAAPGLSEEEQDARLRQLLGETGFRRLAEFQRSEDDRVTTLAGALYYTDAPLTAEQGIRLRQILTQTSQQERNSPPARYWAAVRAEAESFLSAPQLAALQFLQANDEDGWARHEWAYGEPNRSPSP